MKTSRRAASPRGRDQIAGHYLAEKLFAVFNTQLRLRAGRRVLLPSVSEERTRRALALIAEHAGRRMHTVTD